MPRDAWGLRSVCPSSPLPSVRGTADRPPVRNRLGPGPFRGGPWLLRSLTCGAVRMRLSPSGALRFAEAIPPS